MLNSVDQFRPDPPPALTSELYATDLNEVKAYGGAVSALRTPEQLEIARFNTESPARPGSAQSAPARDDPGQPGRERPAARDADRRVRRRQPRLLRREVHLPVLAPTHRDPAGRPDGNPATEVDAGWLPVVPTPNHPEYPAAHGCALGSISETLRGFFGTKKVAFEWDSTVTATTRHYATTDEFIREAMDARVWGGMHFRNSTDVGAHIGRKTAQWMLRDHFEPTSK